MKYMINLWAFSKSEKLFISKSTKKGILKTVQTWQTKIPNGYQLIKKVVKKTQALSL